MSKNYYVKNYYAVGMVNMLEIKLHSKNSGIIPEGSNITSED